MLANGRSEDQSWMSVPAKAIADSQNISVLQEARRHPFSSHKCVRACYFLPVTQMSYVQNIGFVLFI